MLSSARLVVVTNSRIQLYTVLLNKVSEDKFCLADWDLDANYVL